MIVVKLMGGLGNQLFQYAAARALALKHTTTVKLDLSFLNLDAGEQHTQRELSLNVFQMNYEISTPAERNLFKIHGPLKKIIQKYFSSKTEVYKIANENGFGYNEDFFSNPKNTYLNGFWQSEKYFESIRTTLLQEVILSENLSERNLKISRLICSSNAVSLHIRRGDYVTNKNAQTFHGTLSISYYEKAMAYFNAQFPDVKYFIFSDDIPWVKAHLKIENEAVYVDFNSGIKSAFDLYLMSLCKHNIIANSSFSWWGAWLNQNKEKKVIAPMNWFADKSINTSDLIPKSWVKL